MQTRGAYENRQSLQARLLALRIAAVALFLLMAIAFWIIQVVQHQHYAEIAQNNHLRSITLRAPRGLVYDRENRLLVQNRSSFTIALVRERSADIDGTLRLLAEYARVDEETVRAAYARHKGEPVFRAIPLIEHASMAQVAAVMLHGPELPDIDVLEVPTRAYPDGGLGAHIFGYVTEVNSQQLQSEEFAGLTPGAMVGQAGLEREYNGRLMGQDGLRRVVVDSRGREVEPLGSVPATSGMPVQLTIDYDLQRALEDAFQYYGFNGGAVFLDPQTGEVLAFTSLPSFDPNDFATGIDSQTYGALTTDPLKPLYNKVIKGRYPPGSTFKIVMAIAALQEGIITPDHTEYCDGTATIYGSSRQCLGRHGRIDLITALEKSCNIYFYHLGERLDIDVIHRYAKQLGLDGLTGIDLPGEEAGFVGSREWKMRLNGQPWYPGDTISVAIGQGYIGVTPLGLATMISTVANGGTLITPHLVRATDLGQGWQPVPPPPARGQLFLRPAVLDTVREALGRVVQSGTAIRGRIADVPYAGKTGTAQANISLANRRAGGDRFETRDHGFFVFYAPLDDPQIAGVIFGEHAEHGSWTSPVAKHVLETLFAKRQGRPLPELPARAVQASSGDPAPSDGAGGPGIR